MTKPQNLDVKKFQECFNFADLQPWYLVSIMLQLLEKTGENQQRQHEIVSANKIVNGREMYHI